MKFNNINVQISPTAKIGNNVRIGDNSIIYDNVVINDNTIISNNSESLKSLSATTLIFTFNPAL